MAISSTVRRVPDHTADHVNESIECQTKRNVSRLAAATPADIDERLRELDFEWDIERVLETNASIAILTTLTLGATVDRRWFAGTAIIAGFLLQHAVQGWCPPIPVLRRLGIRTSYEIEEERYALKAIRGDFAELQLPSAGDDEIDALERFEGEGGYVHDDPPISNRDAIEDLMVAVRR